MRSIIDRKMISLSDLGCSGGVQPADVRALQLHGTGTGLGDPIEIGAAAAVFSSHSPLTVMAGKSWFGHAEPAGELAVWKLHANEILDTLRRQFCFTAQNRIANLQSFQCWIPTNLLACNLLPSVYGPTSMSIKHCLGSRY